MPEAFRRLALRPTPRTTCPTSPASLPPLPRAGSPATTPPRGTRRSAWPYREAQPPVSTPRPSRTRSSDARLGRRSRLTGGALWALVIAVTAAAPVGAEATGSIGIRLVDAPVTARDDPRAQIYIVDHLAPGTVITRRI